MTYNGGVDEQYVIPSFSQRAIWHPERQLLTEAADLLNSVGCGLEGAISAKEKEPFCPSFLS